ncbi:MEDS domain-containing protein [Actinocorallia populi]|uniref:MEDS domain-containing protein n=1 Tax=Actinocorallia populi TaxID=2079200 RepID=UPI000D08F7A2|nr:MEDS domain-containing protein [Actinocorallia populi]
MTSPHARKAGSRAVGGMKFGDHLCLPYDNDIERRSVLASFVADGLLAGEKVLYVSDGQDPGAVLDWLRGEPDAGPADLDGAVESGHLVIIPAASAYLTTGRFDPDEVVALFGTHLEMAVLQQHTGLRLTCEKTFSLRGWPGSERFAEFEEKIEAIFQSAPVNAMALCQYDTRWFGRRSLEYLLGVHGSGNVRADDVYDDGVLRISPLFLPPGLSLHGAVEESTFAALAAAMKRLGEHTDLLCLDLAEVDFCDMAGLRVMLDARTSEEGGQRQLMLREVPEPVAELIHAAGWGEMPGIHVEEA